jgi:putative ABC transport system permease protein
VNERTREIGVRIALGATRGHILKFIMRRGVVLTLIGLGLGSVASFMLPRFIRSMMNDSVYTAGTVSNSDTVSTTVSVAVAGIVMLLAALLGSYIPARRASLIEPLEALRTD